MPASRHTATGHLTLRTHKQRTDGGQTHRTDGEQTQRTDGGQTQRTDRVCVCSSFVTSRTDRVCVCSSFVISRTDSVCVCSSFVINWFGFQNLGQSYAQYRRNTSADCVFFTWSVGLVKETRKVLRRDTTRRTGRQTCVTTDTEMWREGDRDTDKGKTLGGWVGACVRGCM